LIGQLGGKDFAGARGDRQVEFPPNPSLWRLSQMADVDPQSGAVDEQVVWRSGRLKTIRTVRAASMARSE
jgi:hypothetical protein